MIHRPLQSHQRRYNQMGYNQMGYNQMGYNPIKEGTIKGGTIPSKKVQSKGVQSHQRRYNQRGYNPIKEGTIKGGNLTTWYCSTCPCPSCIICICWTIDELIFWQSKHTNTIRHAGYETDSLLGHGESVCR